MFSSSHEPRLRQSPAFCREGRSDERLLKDVHVASHCGGLDRTCAACDGGSGRKSLAHTLALRPPTG